MTYFAKIGAPKELRISILEAARETLVCMALHKKINHLSDEKKRLISEAKEELRQVSEICAQLEEYFPHKDLKKEAEKEEAERRKEEYAERSLLDEKKLDEKIRRMRKDAEKEKEIRQKQKVQKPKEPDLPSLTDVDRLEYTLQKIEKKLAELNQ
jgi:hypothetical protein